MLYKSHNVCIFKEKMDENDCYTLKFKICRLQLGLQDDSLATKHSEVVNSSATTAQCLLHRVIVQQ